ncbi:MAG: DUF4172 domain-containing protein, partial [Paludibacteraceae bacterium]|nr:DUF4172 domain-containing protein [Paludibacteraceae bacterium]
MNDCMFIWKDENWPHFQWDELVIGRNLQQIRFLQGKLLGAISSFDEETKILLFADSIVNEIVHSLSVGRNEIDEHSVYSSIAWIMGLDVAGKGSRNRYLDDVVESVLDSLSNYSMPISSDALLEWNKKFTWCFPCCQRIIDSCGWRLNDYQFDSGKFGNKKVFYEAPPAALIENMVYDFLYRNNGNNDIDQILKAAN